MNSTARYRARSRLQQARSVSTQEKVDFLSSGAAYPDHPPKVDVRETHMSWVFLTQDHVYKLKKPVRSVVLDFGTVAARKANCRREVRLNRRLAPDIYRGVVALTYGNDGRLALNGEGQVLDWLVKMRRLPADRMLDNVIENGTVSRTDVESVADVLIGFYRPARPARIAPGDYVARFVREQAENEAVLSVPKFELPRETVQKVLRAVDDFVARQSHMLGERIRSGCVVDGHGDLKPEHICLLDPPVIIDCLEFNRLLRSVDPFDELALLALECERLGAGWIGEMIVERCGRALGNVPPDRLLAFYTAFRASLRARLVLSHLLDPEPREPEKWVPLARQYLEIAQRAAVRIAPREAPRSIVPDDSS